MTRDDFARAALAGLLLLGVATAATAQGKQIAVNVLITHLSNQGVGIDPSARLLDTKLRNQLRYNSLRVIKKQRMLMPLDEVTQFDLPNGKTVRVRPIDRNAQGVLMAVDVQGAAKLDARVENHKPLVIRAGPYQKGSLVLSLEPDD